MTEDALMWMTSGMDMRIVLPAPAKIQGRHKVIMEPIVLLAVTATPRPTGPMNPKKEQANMSTKDGHTSHQEVTDE